MLKRSDMMTRTIAIVALPPALVAALYAGAIFQLMTFAARAVGY